MSWFGFWEKKRDDDPTKSLDSDLKEFLDSQQPKPYTPAKVPAPKEAVKSEPEKPRTEVSPEDRGLPRESLFPDGRYKDIWKTYVPQKELDEAISTPAQRVVDAKKDRKSSLSQAALENCAFEEELKRNCFREGDALNRLRARMTLCNRESKTFNRCFQLQAKFLQALGYQGSPTSSVEVDERIQMHADKLYHRMMDYEAEVDDAKAQGKPIPPLTSIFNPARPAPTMDELNLPKNLVNGMGKPLKELPAHEREVAARAILQETKISQQYADDFFAYTTTLNEGRKERQQKLVNAFGETLGKFFIPDAPDSSEIKPIDPKTFEREFWQDDPHSGKG